MYIKILAVSFFILFLQHALRLVYLMGFHVTVFNHRPGPCWAIPGVEHGSEDFETLPNGLTFITSGHRWNFNGKHFIELYEKQGRRGKILLFDFNHPDSGVAELALDPTFPEDAFRPHGISVIQNEETGVITVFVVNHPPWADTIEKFEFIQEEMMLKHIRTYTDNIMTTMNDVAARDENSFYFTNYVYSRSVLGFTLEAYLMLPWGNVVYFDGTGYEVAADSLVIPNGILFSADKRTLYVANSVFMTLNIFQIEDDDKLSIIQEFSLHTGADNFQLDRKTGNLLTGTHPATHLIMEHLEKPDIVKAPSKVLMIHMKNSSYAEGLTDLYTDDGSQISGSTVASLYDNKMLIGSVVDKLVFCEVRTL